MYRQLTTGALAAVLIAGTAACSGGGGGGGGGSQAQVTGGKPEDVVGMWLDEKGKEAFELAQAPDVTAACPKIVTREGNRTSMNTYSPVLIQADGGITGCEATKTPPYRLECKTPEVKVSLKTGVIDFPKQSGCSGQVAANDKRMSMTGSCPGQKNEPMYAFRVTESAWLHYFEVANDCFSKANAAP